jgi:hypothetical protein
MLVLLLTFYSCDCTELGSLIQRYLALLIARLRFAKNVPEYEGSFALDCYAKVLREQRQKLKIGDPTSPIRFVVVFQQNLVYIEFLFSFYYFFSTENKLSLKCLIFSSWELH